MATFVISSLANFLRKFSTARPGFATVVGIRMLLPVILTFKESEQISICFFVPKIGIRRPISTFTFLSEILSKFSFIQFSLPSKNLNRTSWFVFTGAVSVTLSFIDETLSDNLVEFLTFRTATFIWGFSKNNMDFDINFYNFA